MKHLVEIKLDEDMKGIIFIVSNEPSIVLYNGNVHYRLPCDILIPEGRKIKIMVENI